MRRLLLICTLFAALPAILPASQFDWMTREFARQSGTPQMHIPFFGLARFVVAVAHPAGTSELKLAIFEHPHITADDFSRIADSTVGRNWKPIVRVREQTGDSSNIYVQPDGKHLRVLIASYDKSEAVFVEVRIHPEELMKFVDEHRHHSHQA